MLSRNLGLLGLLFIPLMASVFLRDPDAGPRWSWPLSLAFGLVGVLAFAPNRKRTLMNMDWAVASILAGMMIAVPDNRNLEYALAAAGGLICGFIVARPRFAYLLARPGLTPWIALLAAAFSAGIFLLSANEGQTAIYFGNFTWPVLCALAVAGFCFASGRTAIIYWALPWLAALAGIILNPVADAPMHLRLPVYRAAALTLPIFFIAPQMARTRLELLVYEAFLIILLFCLPSFVNLFFDPALLLSGLIFAPRLILDQSRQNRAPEVPDQQPPLKTGANNQAWLQCGHGGSAPHLGQWRGLPSCRLAAEHDGGPLLCPYGCLGLGDCQRVCPAGAISLASGFPVIDPARCRGCGRCWSVCPKQLFELHDGEVRAFIPCASQSGLKNNAQYCDKSCLGCGKCRKACPAKAIGRSGDSGAMTVDQAACRAYGEACGQACREACPRKIIEPGR